MDPSDRVGVGDEERLSVVEGDGVDVWDFVVEGLGLEDRESDGEGVTDCDRVTDPVGVDDRDLVVEGVAEIETVVEGVAD